MAAIIHRFETALDHLESIRGGCSNEDSDEWVRGAMIVLRLVRTFYMCIKKCLVEGAGSCESVVLCIEDALPKCATGIQSLSHRLLGDDQLTFDAIKDDGASVVTEFLGSIEAQREEIEELRLICSDRALQSSPLPQDEVLDLTSSLLENLQDFLRQAGNYKLQEDPRKRIAALQGSVRFLKNLIHFAAFRGLHHAQMEHLFTLTQGFVLNASVLLSHWCLFDDSASYMLGDISWAIKPIKPHVHEIYVRVLLASKSSQSSHTPTPESCKTMLGDFIDSLKHNLLELLNLHSRFLVSFNFQMLKLQEALGFLKAVMREQHNYYETRHDLIGVLICEAGIVICSLFMATNEQALVKDLDSMFSDVFIKIIFSDVFNKIKQIKAGAIEINPIASELSFPRTNMPGFVDSVLSKLKSFSQCPQKAHSVPLAKDQLQTVQDGLEFLASFLGGVQVLGEEQKNIQTLWSHVAWSAYQIEFIVDSLVVGDTLTNLLVLPNFIREDIKLIQTPALKTFPCKGHGVKVQKVPESSPRLPSVSSTPLFTDDVVGFDDEAKEIIDKLVGGTRKLDIVSVVGMPGIGKTTLCKKIYDHPSISKHFYFRSWCTVSHEYSKNDLLREILQHHVTSEEIENNKDDLAGFLRKYLKGKRYLIILDDVWDYGAWNDLNISFPDDGNQSRVLLTSRHYRVAVQIRPDNEPHAIRLLNNDESWELLQKKVFGDKNCSSALCDRGKRIAIKCKGLPLTIVLVAGILASMPPDTWAQVEGHLSEASVDQCKKLLELSYYHLPEYLKSCFLYFGMFSEDQQIPVQRLLWLWIAEGFIGKSEKKCLELVAEEYMMELIERNLVIIAKKASTGRVKACTVHDLLHEFCVAKGKEEHFMYWLLDNDELYTFNETTIVHRLCVPNGSMHLAESNLAWPYLRTLHWHGGCWENFSHIFYLFNLFKLVRVLDFRGYALHAQIRLFVHLRYLAMRCFPSSIPSSLGKLSNLETLILVGDRPLHVLMPETLWNMKKLRHLYIENAWLRLAEEDLQGFSSLENLDTVFGFLILKSERVLQKFPCIRQLRCKFNIKSDGKIIALDFMSQLESLHLAGTRHTRLIFQFPLNLKKLVLSELFLPWSIISAIAELPNLEILKLLWESFLGVTWDLKSVQFSALRVLKLEGLHLISWTGLDDHFPCLQKLVLRSCVNLKELPSCLGYISTLEMIHVHGCGLATSSIKEIREVLMNEGNEDVKMLVD